MSTIKQDQQRYAKELNSSHIFVKSDASSNTNSTQNILGAPFFFPTHSSSSSTFSTINGFNTQFGLPSPLPMPMSSMHTSLTAQISQLNSMYSEMNTQQQITSKKSRQPPTMILPQNTLSTKPSNASIYSRRSTHCGYINAMRSKEIGDYKNYLNGSQPGSDNVSYNDVINYDRASKNELRHCVMCGLSEGDHCKIPSNQNKDVCRKCDSTFWLLKDTSIVVKFCKGCKNFFSLVDFEGKPDASKCATCRRRGRDYYQSKISKEVVVKIPTVSIYEEKSITQEPVQKIGGSQSVEVQSGELEQPVKKAKLDSSVPQTTKILKEKISKEKKKKKLPTQQFNVQDSTSSEEGINTLSTQGRYLSDEISKIYNTEARYLSEEDMKAMIVVESLLKLRDISMFTMK